MGVQGDLAARLVNFSQIAPAQEVAVSLLRRLGRDEDGERIVKFLEDGKSVEKTFKSVVDGDSDQFFLYRFVAVEGFDERGEGNDAVAVLFEIEKILFKLRRRGIGRGISRIVEAVIDQYVGLRPQKKSTTELEEEVAEHRWWRPELG